MLVQLFIFSLSVCAASQGFAFGKGSGKTGRGMVGPLAFQHLPAKLLRPLKQVKGCIPQHVAL